MITLPTLAHAVHRRSHDGCCLQDSDAQTKNGLRLALTCELVARVQRVRMFGAASIDLAWVAEGKVDALVMMSNKPWDTAAGVLIVREAGAGVVDLDGSPHTMNSAATIAASPKILADLVELIAEARKDVERSESSSPD
ncbi:inositol monophosphatase family protein [Streptosporangium sp. G11]|uniref:inositol monophosphatase family protein n=1 Tax=Streptosporangium sp. G11 TaxID=3436926 RepID=UPI003EB959E1